MRRKAYIELAGEHEEEQAGAGVHTVARVPIPPSFLGAFTAAVIAFWIVVGAFAFHTNQPDNALTTTWQADIKPIVQTLLPEQWGFFTKSPRDDILLPFSYSEEMSWSSAALYPHSQIQYAFGLNRVSRAQGLEVGIVYKGIIDSNGSWIDCGDYDRAVECLGASSQEPEALWLRVSNSSPNPTLCGRSALSKAQPAPWACANIGQTQQSVAVILVDIVCSTD